MIPLMISNLLLSKQDEKPERFEGNFQSLGKHFISFIPNSSISSEGIPN